ncbi:Threonine aspartase 1 [Cytospora mali]|uniref:Threonine aspartase 1 n=1 Tax=Cytospora mali TaxID=578113 RepID=A0A194VTG3_CYTMA|nr:Threonine aspartase 1 [Valsa mali]
MNILRSFSSHKAELDGYSVMLGSGDIDNYVARQLSTYIKEDKSLCRYLHVFHSKPDPYIDGGGVRTWFVDSELVEIKDWLVDDCDTLSHYPFPLLNFWPDHNYHRKLLAQGFDDNKVAWKHHQYHTSAEASKVKPSNLSVALNNLDLNPPHTPESPVSFIDLTTMDSADPQSEGFEPKSIAAQSPRMEDSADHLDATADGTVDRFIKKRVAVPDERSTMAVFVHAGAGYHSYQNEHIHLTMCAKAASQAMRCMKAGGTSTDAVAVALQLLEDNDITNAGIGSNLTIDGQVECDATIVDHFGRSGACGAVPNIKNPILLAKLILETSLVSLPLRRVPPNILIGEGAKKFAAEHGMTIVSNKDLVSKNAEDRFKKWCEDLRKAEARSKGIQFQSSTAPMTPPNESSQAIASMVVNTPQSVAHSRATQGLLRDHTSAVLTGMWNEGQPDSPSAEAASPGAFGSDPATPTKRSPLSASQNGYQAPKYSRGGFDATNHQVRALDTSDESVEESSAKRRKTSKDKPVGPMDGVKDDMDGQWGWLGKGKANQWITDLEDPDDNKKIDSTELTAEPAGTDPDLITDTIGVIVIDGKGNIAAGSSSGGIGMKHCGRIGPAALVGIGTAVIPRDKNDEDERVVAAVTSGTGEHMATTMAAHKCAERLYHMTSRGPGGDDALDVCTEAEVMEDFIMEDFMGHPGVKNQTSARAIGVLAVKMTAGGIYMHWAHNTDSFALAHMASYDKEPKCVMSRLGSGMRVNVGAQKVQKNYLQGRKFRGI